MHIFTAGTHTDASGTQVAITPEELAKTASTYNPALHEAPIVVGHPTLDAPAYGWVKSLELQGTQLYAEPQQVDPTFAEWVQAGRFKKVSASFYTPTAPTNPVPGVYTLRHVGFLGATPPAIKGLKAVAFGEAEEGVIEFSDWTDGVFLSVLRNLRDFMIDQFGLEQADKVVSPFMLEQAQAELVMRQVAPSDMPIFSENPDNPMATKPKTTDAKPTDGENSEAATTDFAERETQIAQREQALAAREAALSRVEHVNFCDGLVNAGKLLPAQRQRAVELLCFCSSAAGTVNFGEGETAFNGTVKDLFKSFLESQPKVVEYSEVAGADKGEPLTDPNQIAKAVTDYMESEKAKGNQVSFAEALTHVQG